MAKMLSQVASVIRGSVGGATYTANQFASIIMRARTNPTQPRTTFQTYARDALAAGSLAWAALTDAQRADWELYAQSCLYTSPVAPYYVTGRDIFLAGRTLVNYIGQRLSPAPIAYAIAPTVPGFYAVGGVSIQPPAALATGFKVRINNFGANGVHYAIQISQPFDVTRNRFQGPWNNNISQFGSLAAATSVDVPVVGLTAGRVYFVRVRIVTTTLWNKVATPSILRAIATLGV